MCTRIVFDEFLDALFVTLYLQHQENRYSEFFKCLYVPNNHVLCYVSPTEEQTVLEWNIVDVAYNALSVDASLPFRVAIDCICIYNNMAPFTVAV